MTPRWTTAKAGWFDAVGDHQTHVVGAVSSPARQGCGHAPCQRRPCSKQRLLAPPARMPPATTSGRRPRSATSSVGRRTPPGHLTRACPSTARRMRRRRSDGRGRRRQPLIGIGVHPGVDRHRLSRASKAAIRSIWNPVVQVHNTAGRALPSFGRRLRPPSSKRLVTEIQSVTADGQIHIDREQVVLLGVAGAPTTRWVALL